MSMASSRSGTWGSGVTHGCKRRWWPSFGTGQRNGSMQAVPEWGVQVAPTRFRIPDVCVVPGLEEKEPILSKPPFICIEILSSEDRMPRIQERVNDYFAFGVL